MDFAEPPAPIDDRYPYLLAVRDLASGQQLAWLPLPSATAFDAIRALEPLFVLWGAPLVLKSDNGSHFGAEHMQIFLDPWGVEQLFSPPRMPSYNGSIEAGMALLKTRTEYHATSAGRPTYWTCQDTEGGARPGQCHGATPRPDRPDARPALAAAPPD